MTAPRRWKDTPGAPIGVRELLASARPTQPISSEALERGARRIGAIGTIPIVATLWPKLAAAAVVGVASIAIVATVRSRSLDHEARNSERSAPTAATSQPKPTPIASASPAVVAPPDPDPPPSSSIPATHAVSPAGVARTVPIAASTSAPEPAPIPTTAPSQAATVETAPSTLSAELVLLEEARHKLARDPHGALGALAEHRVRYPSGVLAAERDLIELDALRRAGREAEAKRRARAWLDREPAGIHAPRVRGILASLDMPH